MDSQSYPIVGTERFIEHNECSSYPRTGRFKSALLLVGYGDLCIGVSCLRMVEAKTQLINVDRFGKVGKHRIKCPLLLTRGIFLGLWDLGKFCEAD